MLQLLPVWNLLIKVKGVSYRVSNNLSDVSYSLTFDIMIT